MVVLHLYFSTFQQVLNLLKRSLEYIFHNPAFSKEQIKILWKYLHLFYNIIYYRIDAPLAATSQRLYNQVLNEFAETILRWMISHAQVSESLLNVVTEKTKQMDSRWQKW